MASPLYEVVARYHAARSLVDTHQRITYPVMEKIFRRVLRSQRKSAATIAWRCGGVKTIRYGVCHVCALPESPLKEWSDSCPCFCPGWLD